MKKIVSLILAAMMLVAFVPAVSAAEGDMIIDGNTGVCVLPDAGESGNYAAERLIALLSEALGENPVRGDNAANVIYVGPYGGELADNGYVIRADGGNLYIEGTGVRGTLHGVYRFLEDFCGLKFYADNCRVLPAAESITVPADTDIRYEPFFEYTDTDWESPRDKEYSIANGLTGGTYRSLSKAQGGTVNYLGNFCHTLTNSLCAAGTYFDSHPEYFALRDGKRIPRQLCLTNEDTLRIVTEEVLAMLARGHDADASVQIVSLTQNDNYDYCECDKCKAFEKAHGNVRSATMINFVNQVADAVAEAGYDNIAIDTFAYQYTRQAPTGIVPRPNVIVRLCTIEGCFAHALDDKSCKQNADIMKDLDDWSKICNRIYIWDYTTNYAHTCCVFPDFGVIQKNIQVFYEHNVKGIYEEGNYYMSSCDAEFGDLRSYLISKCLQDPYCDYDAEINGFMEAFYGAGWRNIRKAYDLYVANAGNISGHLSIYQSSKENLTLTTKQVAEIDGYWQAAKDAAETDFHKANLERSELSWRFWKANRRAGEFSLLNPKRFVLKEELYSDLKDAGVTMISEGSYGQYLECQSVRYTTPDEWNGFKEGESGTKAMNFFGKLLEMLTPFLAFFGAFYALKNSILK